jgi:hypothetical protein
MQILITSGPEDPIMPILLYFFKDVHAVLTSETRLKRFQQLPYAAIKAWASSDDLVVDSENSVAVAVGVWVQTLVNGYSRASTQKHKEELSKLIRVQRLSPGGWACGRAV